MTDEKIVPTPSLRPQIIEAINNGQFAIFFGAGISMLIGCSSWDRLAENLIEKCFTTPKNDDSSKCCITFKEKEALQKMVNPKKIITICQYILNKNGFSDEFFNEILKSLDPDPTLLERQNIYNELYGLRGLFITTNIDTHFDNKFHPARIVYQLGDFEPDIIPETIHESKLYHIHGSILDRSSIVISVKDYLDRYNDARFQTFLRKIFSEKVILFIGYGLNEFEVLDFLIAKSRGYSLPEAKHFILLPYYRGEETLLEYEEHYFSQFGISVIPYLKDEKGYGQIYDIVKKWNRDITLQTRFLHDAYDELKRAADHYDSELEDRIFQLIKNDKSLEFEFFRQLSKSENPTSWLKPVTRRGYFDPQNNPASTAGFGSYWNAMAALENIANVNGSSPITDITEDIISIINLIIDYRDDKGQRIENPLTDRHIIRIIFLLPLERISDYYFEFIRKCLNSQYEPVIIAEEIGDRIIPKLFEIDRNVHLINILDIILDFKESKPRRFEDYSSILGQYYLQILLEKHSEHFIKVCNLQAIDIALEKIELIVTKDDSQFHEIWTPSIREKCEFKDRYDNQIIHFIWTGFKILGPIEIRQRVYELLKKEHPIFKRIAICAIDEYYSELKDLFWQCGVNPLDEYHIKHEVYELFNNHCLTFSDNEIQTILDWIETASYYEYRVSDDEDVQQKYLARCKKEWLLSLLSTNNPDVQKIYEKYHTINPVEISHPGRTIVVEHMSGSISPISKEDLLEKSNQEIVQYLNGFKEDDIGWSKISVHSLGDIFRMCIIENPQKFVDDLDPFLDLKRIFQFELFFGLSEAWREGKNYEWKGVFLFINNIINSEDFWLEVYQEGRSNYRNWIISRIAVLIEEGTKNDAHLFDLELLPEAERILLKLANEAESDLYNMGDLATSVLNSNKGNIYSAMISYSLCFARHYRKDVEQRWVDSIEKEFERRLDPDIEPSVELSVTLGKFFANLCYLNKKWVVDNVNKIFPKENETHWNAAFSSYLFYSKVYKSVYKLLKSHGHYEKALTTDFSDPHINENIIHQILIGYLEGFEEIEDESGLLIQILDIWKSKQIVELIRFLWWYGQRQSQEKRQKILPLWKIIFEKASQDITNVGNIQILSELNDWVLLTDDLNDDICNWLKSTVKYIKPHEFEFIEQLIRHSEKKPKCTGEIFISMAESGHFFEYKKEEIIKFVTILYSKDEKKIADTICNLYLEIGYDFLQPVYAENIKNNLK